jgi:hypothetical protein
MSYLEGENEGSRKSDGTGRGMIRIVIEELGGLETIVKGTGKINVFDICDVLDVDQVTRKPKEKKGPPSWAE